MNSPIQGCIATRCRYPIQFPITLLIRPAFVFTRKCFLRFPNHFGLNETGQPCNKHRLFFIEAGTRSPVARDRRINETSCGSFISDFGLEEIDVKGFSAFNSGIVLSNR